MLQDIFQVCTRLDENLSGRTVITYGCHPEIHYISQSFVFIYSGRNPFLEYHVVRQPGVKSRSVDIEYGEHILSGVEFVAVRVRIWGTDGDINEYGAVGKFSED